VCNDARKEAGIVAGSLGLSRCNNIRDFERGLRDAGLSRKRATAVAAHGFAGLNLPVEQGDDEEERLAETIARLTAIIKDHSSPGKGGERDVRKQARGCHQPQRDAEDGAYTTQRQPNQTEDK
jgi:hypothetical protein